MSKELQALEEIQRIYTWFQNYVYAEKLDKKDINLFNTIETALKRLEEKEHNCEVYLKQMNGLTSKLAKYEKEHKALEIIKKLNPYTVVEVQGQWYLMIGDIFVKAPKIPITEESAILLKEELK